MTDKQKYALYAAGGIGILALATLSSSKGRQLVSSAADLAKQAGETLQKATQAQLAKVFNQTEKNISTLDQKMQPIVREFVRRATAAGLPVAITSGRRTMAEQKALYDQGRTSGGSIVTNAKPGESAHNFGLAVDFAPLNSVGMAHWPDNYDWGKVAAIGKALGLSWGGDWTGGFVDKPHLEFSAWKVAQADWKAGKLQVAGLFGPERVKC